MLQTQSCCDVVRVGSLIEVEDIKVGALVMKLAGSSDGGKAKAKECRELHVWEKECTARRMGQFMPQWRLDWIRPSSTRLGKVS